MTWKTIKEHGLPKTFPTGTGEAKSKLCLVKGTWLGQKYHAIVWYFSEEQAGWFDRDANEWNYNVDEYLEIEDKILVEFLENVKVES